MDFYIYINKYRKMIALFCSIILLFISSLIYGQDSTDYELVSVQFHGNASISTAELQKVVISQESPGWFSQFLNSFSSWGEAAVVFDSLSITIDVEELKNIYWSNGFFKARFWPKYYLDKQNMEATIVFHIDEGDPAFFRDFSIAGLEKIPPEFRTSIDDMITIDSTYRYSDALVESNRINIMNYLRDHGFMLMESASPLVDIDTSINKVDLKLGFSTGRRYKVSEVKVHRSGAGKELVDDNLLKDIVGIEKDKYYSYYDLQRGQIRLYRTNLFNTALVAGMIADTSGNQVPINISADVGLLHELSPEFIINNEDNSFNLGIGLGFVKKNFLGSARKLTLSTSAAAQNIAELLANPSINDTNFYGYADARVILDQPYLFGKPVSTKLETYYTLQKRKDEYNATLFGVKLGFDFELPRYTYLTSLFTYLNWESSKYVFREDYTKSLLSATIIRESPADSVDYYLQKLDEIAVGSSTSKSANAILGLQFGANKANDILFPTKGYSINLLLEDGNSIQYLLGKIWNYNLNRPLFYKVYLSTTSYLDIFSSDQDAFGTKFRVGHIHAYSGNKFDIPLNLRFSAGGSNSVRGWTSRELVPAETQLPANPTDEEIESVLLRGITPGGFFLLEGSFEARNRLIGKIGSAVFIDYGNTWNSYKDLQLDEVAVAAGFGFRYYSDFAPIRIDFGFKLYDPADRYSFIHRLGHRVFWDVFEFHFGIGEAF